MTASATPASATRARHVSGTVSCVWRAALAIALLGFLPALAHDAAASDDRVGSPPTAINLARPATLESTNRAVADALRRQMLAPTLDNERRLAGAYREAGVLDRALDHYQAALRLDPHDGSALEGSARVWRDWGYPAVALPLAYRAVFWAPDSAATQTTLGTVLLALGRLDAARVRFLAARRLAPYAGFASNNLCFLELRRGRASDAMTYCQQAAVLDPTSQVVRNNLAIAFVMLGADQAALTAFEAGSTPAVAAYNQGVLWLLKGETRQARDAFSRSRQADPSFRPPLSQLRQLSSMQELH